VLLPQMSSLQRKSTLGLNGGTAFNLFLICVCIGLAALFLFLVFANCWPGPYEDYWADTATIEKFYQGHLNFQDLIMAHNNAHRILIPRLLFFADYKLVSGNNQLLIFISLICKFLLILLANVLLRDQKTTTRIVLNAVLFSAVLNSATAYHTVFNINFQWDLMILFSCLSLYFYVKACEVVHQERLYYLVMSFLLCLLGILSNGGALVVPFVFLFVSWVKKDKFAAIATILVFSFVFYLNFAVLPISTPDEASYEAIIPSWVFKTKTVLFFVFNLMSAGLYKDQSALGVYFSTYFCILLIMGFFLSRKSQGTCNNMFLYVAVLTFFIMIIVAGVRSEWLRNSWAETRYKIISLLFIASLTIHAFFMTERFFVKNALSQIQFLIVAHGLLLAFIVYYFSCGILFEMSNRVFDSHAYMFMHERNRLYGHGLHAHRAIEDPIEAIDPFFKTYGYAYYHNKQGKLVNRDATPVGSPLVPGTDIDEFKKQCAPNSGEINQTIDESNDINIEMPLNTKENSFLKAVLVRDSYYLLDAEGIVVGFAYIYINPESHFTTASIKGYAYAKTGKYVAEIADEKVHCLYALNGNQY